ncbi:MAG: SdiA-regulated domain-containing protein [Candidatus Accumulibacter sp.]|nr:SdiA-regulated domain-containing protein [Accumulibacter sp.]
MSLRLKSRFRRYLVPALALACLLGLAGAYLGWFEIALHRLLIGTSGESPARLGLEDYCVGIDAQPVAGIEDNLSGLTYHPVRHSLFSVINRPPQIIELTLDGRLKRSVPVKGVADLEGISHMRGDEFFIADERTQQLIHVEIGDGQREIDAQGRPRIGLAFDLADNLGFEGVSWDHTRSRLFVVKEKLPLRLFEFSGLIALFDERRLDLQVGEWPLRGSFAWLFRDLSSLSYHEDSGNMLLLSDESRLLVELDPRRQPSGLMVLRRGWHGLKADVPQAEGIAVGTRGEIFLVSEPNLFYRFDPRCR